jgi:hypothetical protein
LCPNRVSNGWYAALVQQRPSGHVYRHSGRRGDVWRAKYRLPDGRQVHRTIGPAWTQRGRPPAGYFTKRTAEDWLRETLDQARRGTLPQAAAGGTARRPSGRRTSEAARPRSRRAKAGGGVVAASEWASGVRHFAGMREKATLKLDGGEELRVEVDREDLDRDEIVVRRASTNGAPADDLIAVIDDHLATAKRRPAGTTDRLLQADRERPY